MKNEMFPEKKRCRKFSMEFPFMKFYWKLRKSQGFLLHVNLMFPRIILYRKLMFHAVSTDKAL